MNIIIFFFDNKSNYNNYLIIYLVIIISARDRWILNLEIFVFINIRQIMFIALGEYLPLKIYINYYKILK